MFMLQAAGAPVVIKTDDGRMLRVPKLTMDDITGWGAEIVAEREDKMTEGLNDDQRRQYLQMYPTIPPDINEMRRLVRTPLGMTKVLLTCLMRADKPLSEDEARAVVRQNSPYKMLLLAITLADLEDTSNIIPPTVSQPNGQGGDAGADPLKPIGMGASRGSPATGMPILRPSTPPMASTVGEGGHTPSSKDDSAKPE